MKPIINKACGMCGGEMRVIAEHDEVYRLVCACCGSEEDYSPSGAVGGTNAASGIYDKVIRGVVEVEVSDGFSGGAGSGFFVSPDLVLTNRHVVTVRGKMIDSVTVVVNGKKVSGTVLCAGADVDLALLRVSASTGKALTLADSARVKNGDSVYIIGNALGMGTCITSGIVSDRSRMIDGTAHIMTDAAVNHGNSGGPMFDATGKVVGVIVSGIEKANGMSFAIPSTAAQAFIRKANAHI